MEASTPVAPETALGSGVVVYKMTGSGNDFVFADGRATALGFWTPRRIQEVCDRQAGVGADGLVVLDPGSGTRRVRLHYFNRDGLRAELCGNASLCAARLAVWVELAPPGDLVLETDAGPVAARCLGGPGELAEIALDNIAAALPACLELQHGEESAAFVRVGVPHLVVRVQDLAVVDVARRGAVLRRHQALGAEGANVDFVAGGSAGWAMRTYERGVEAETLACGTGAVAVAVSLATAGVAQLPLPIRTASGRTLTVSGSLGEGGGFHKVRLVGEGRIVFRAILGA